MNSPTADPDLKVANLRRSLALVAAFVASVGFAGLGRAAATDPTLQHPRSGEKTAVRELANQRVHGCLDVIGKTRHVRIRARGERIKATILGTGRVAIVLANQTDNSTCRWSPFPQFLAAHGYRVLAFEYSFVADPSAEVLATAGYLRRHGARAIVLIGASIGGAVVIDAGVHLRPVPSAVVSLSAVPSATVYPFPRDARRLPSPIFQIGGTDDPETSYGKDTRILYRASPSPAKRLLLIPGTTHGVDFVGAGAGNRVRKAILTFIRAHTHRRR
jgi:hypothetical protein